MKRSKPLLAVVALASVGFLTGCATGQPPGQTSESGLSAGKADLSVKMSKSIFLQPVGPSKKVVYVDGHNTSSAQGLNFDSELDRNLEAKGYRVTNNPDKAHYMLMYNIKYLGKAKKTHTMAGALAGGYGGALIGSMASDNPYSGGGTGALLGAAAGALAGHFLADKKYLMVVDVQLEQRDRGATTRTQSNASQGTATSSQTSGSVMHGWMVYRDRIVAQAKGMRLTFSYAKPALVKEISGELTGLF